MSRLSGVKVTHSLTDGRDDDGGEVEGARELPLNASVVRDATDDVSPYLVPVSAGQVEACSDVGANFLQLAVLGRFRFRFERVKDGGADEQVGEGAHDER